MATNPLIRIWILVDLNCWIRRTSIELQPMRMQITAYNHNVLVLPINRLEKKSPDCLPESFGKNLDSKNYDKMVY
jgi:hypothetical protein